MKKKNKKRPSLLKPNKRVPIEHRSTTMNVSNKIRVEGGLVGLVERRAKNFYNPGKRK